MPRPPADPASAVWNRLDELDRRLLAAAAHTPRRRPWIRRERETLLHKAQACLGIRSDWVPRIRLRDAAASRCSGIVVERLHATSWKGCHTVAHLYHPHRPASRAWPLVILCCGHGNLGKQSAGYQRVAWCIAQAGAAVLVPDNIGQGERVSMGHRDAHGPFHCGTSLQGLIIMETMAWLRWARNDARFDRNRIAAIGNSGGGVLTLFFGALCRDELAALSSSGYPSAFAFVAQKEKHFCNCNLLPGVVGELEMWQLYGCVAPKPLFLFQGRSDNLFPVDLFHRMARNVAEVYRRQAVEPAFQAEVFEGAHSWDDARGAALTAFLQRTLHLPSRKLADPEQFQTPPGNCLKGWPARALTADAVASQITGKPLLPGADLCDLYCPDLPASLNLQLGRADFRRLAAQQTGFLAPSERPGFARR